MSITIFVRPSGPQGLRVAGGVLPPPLLREPPIGSPGVLARLPSVGVRTRPRAEVTGASIGKASALFSFGGKDAAGASRLAR